MPTSHKLGNSRLVVEVLLLMTTVFVSAPIIKALDDDGDGLHDFHAGEKISASEVNDNFKAVNSAVQSVKEDCGLRWVGYTSEQYTGDFCTSSEPACNYNVAGVRLANVRCDAQYPGSRAMTFEDWRKVSHQLTFEQEVWLIGGSYVAWEGARLLQLAYDSVSGEEISSNGYLACGGWDRTSSSYQGPVLGSSGRITLVECNNNRAFACVE